MAYVNILSSESVKDSRAKLLNRDEELRANFAGTAFPVAGASMVAPVVGQTCYRTDLNKMYVCTDATTPVWEELNLDVFLALTGGTLTGLLKLAEGAAIASASTINLSTATGNFLHITGTTTITAMTLDQGQLMFLVFDGALNITLSATLLGPPTGNTGTLAMAAGDSLMVVGEGGGVSRILSVSRYNGYAVLDSRYSLADGTRAFTVAPTVTGAGRLMRPASGTAANSGLVSWGTAAPGTLAEGEIYLRYAA